MKVKKRYYVACVLMCVLALVLSVFMFNFEMGFARYTKLNNVTHDTWIVTSASETGNSMNTNLFVNKARTVEEAEIESGYFKYLGKQTVVDGKIVAYDMEKWVSTVVINREASLGDRIEVYYKPDEPLKLYCRTDVLPYIIAIIITAVVAVALVILCRVINKNLKDNTFSDSPVTFMDIPIAVIVAGIILSFFAGMLIGNIQVDASYTNISQALAEQYAAHELAF